MGPASVWKLWENQNKKKFKTNLLNMMVLNFLYSNSYHFLKIIINVITIIIILVILVIIIILFFLLLSNFSLGGKTTE